jgi:murein DD-endopeptidase MepM/ murein hydrolase activator NlpD
MKIKLWLISVILLMLGMIGLATHTYLSFLSLRDHNVVHQPIFFNEHPIDYHQAKVEHSLLGGLIKFDQTYENIPNSLIVTHSIVNYLEAPHASSIQYINPQGEVYKFENVHELIMDQDGLYLFEITESYDNREFFYTFQVELSIVPEIFISNLKPYQGDIILVKLSNLPKDRTLSINSHFRASALYETNYEAFWYLPLAYREKAQRYPLTISVNDKTYEYTLDVQAYEFKEIRFTVDSSVVSSTVGNNEAVLQYRAIIWLTYETYDVNDYWQEPFMIPVENARISSTFGEMRFVNNASTPTRHAGIDYAIACGTPVYASNRGKVEVAQFLIMIGNTIVIDHGLGLKTYYEHMKDILIKAGDMVERGQQIGTVGTTGYSTGCHLHFQAMIKNQSINPEFLYELRK